MRNIERCRAYIRQAWNEGIDTFIVPFHRDTAELAAEQVLDDITSKAIKSFYPEVEVRTSHYFYRITTRKDKVYCEFYNTGDAFIPCVKYIGREAFEYEYVWGNGTIPRKVKKHPESLVKFQIQAVDRIPTPKSDPILKEIEDAWGTDGFLTAHKRYIRHWLTTFFTNLAYEKAKQRYHEPIPYIKDFPMPFEVVNNRVTFTMTPKEFDEWAKKAEESNHQQMLQFAEHVDTLYKQWKEDKNL